MIRTVSNSSPIIGLSIIHKLHLLWDLFDEVYIPIEVYNEVVYGNKFKSYGEKELSIAVREGRVKVYEVKQKQLVEQLNGRLHKGELEVIVAAKELDIPTVVIDDRSARKFAETMVLKPIGLIGILIAAKRYNKLPQVKKYLDMLIKEEYRISKKLYAETLKKLEE